MYRNRRHGRKSEYQEHAESFDKTYREVALRRLQSQHGAVRQVPRLAPSALTARDMVAVVARAEADDLRTDGNVLVRAEKASDAFEPMLFHRYEEVAVKTKELLGYKAAVIGKVLGRTPTHGQIICGSEFMTVRVPLSPFIAKAEQILQRIEALREQELPLILCPHCDVCEFSAECHTRAVEEDNLSLLQGMRRGHIAEQNKKGIFTLRQFSYTFRPRRPPKRARHPATPRHFALQAQALRENRVYIHGTPELPSTDPAVYVDIEGIPGRAFYYLIGMLIVRGDTEQYQGFWADDRGHQVDMLTQFADAVGALPGAPLFHYGSYDVKAIEALRDGMGNTQRSTIDPVLAACCNVLSLVHPHCYFPLYSNRLREVARFLGYEFTGPIRSSVDSIIFRERWEATGDPALKEALIAYNRQDCEALRTLCAFLRQSVGLAAAHGKVPGREEGIVPTDTLRRPGEGNRPTFRKAEFAYPEFELVNKCAYFDYQRDHVVARTEKRPLRPAKPKRARKTERRASLSTEVSAPLHKCPTCGSRALSCEQTLRRWLIDLKYYKTGIGVKKWQPRYLIRQYRCYKCGGTFKSPDVFLDQEGRSLYGHGLVCWCVYQNIVGKQAMFQVYRSLQDIFGLTIHHSITYHFKTRLARHYQPLGEEILAALLGGPLICIDETPVKLRKTTGYVWVLASMTAVYFLFRDSREGTFLQDLLGTYRGILVSDFFTAYDSLPCRQQKCLIHLMRDLNDDLRRNPYDEELRSVATPFAELLKDIVMTIDRYGLRKYHLHKHVQAAERFCGRIARRQFDSERALKYQRRIDKYGDRLFTFLHHDGVPWHNNTAEHAVHSFAKLRRFSDGMFTRASVEELLTLVTVLQTCEYNQVNPLKFLLSGKNQLGCIMSGERLARLNL
jgi:predicted RecB family nuclease